MFTMRKYIVSLGGKRYIALNEIKHVISASSTIAFKVTFMVSTDFFFFLFIFFFLLEGVKTSGKIRKAYHL